MHAVGNSHLYEDFIEPTAQLLEQQAATLPNHDGGAALLAIFNDDERSSQLTYSFKVSQISQIGQPSPISFAKVIPAHHQCMDEVQCTILCWLLTRHGRPCLLPEKH